MSETPRPNPARFLPKKVERTPGDFGRGHLKVDSMLRPEDRDAYMALLRQPGTTGRKAWEWLKAKGYVVGPGAVKHHKRRFDQQLRELRSAAEMSLVCADLVRQVGINRMSDAAVLRFEALLTEQLFSRYQSGEKIDDKEWQTLGRALTAAVTNRNRVEMTRIAGEEARRDAGQDARPTRKRLDGVTISDKVRKILGVPLPGEPLPALPPPIESPPPAPEGRQTLAHDATRGETSGEATSPGGAIDLSPRRQSWETGSNKPSPGGA